MTALRELLTRLWWTVRPGPHDADLEQELSLHVELANNGRTGTTDGASRRATPFAMGVTHATDALRDQRGLPWLADLLRDASTGRRSEVSMAATARSSPAT